MATAKKYVVRDGFVVVLKLSKNDGSAYERRYESGEEISLDEDQAAAHQHKLEFASQRDRDVALAAEQADAASKTKINTPVAPGSAAAA